MPRQRKDFLLNPMVIIIIAVIIIVAVFNFYQNIEKINKLETKVEKLKSEISSAKQHREMLKYRIENSDNYKYIEEVAREKLGLVKPGEKVLIPVPETESDQKNNSNN
jgi:cell division protein FtsB